MASSASRWPIRVGVALSGGGAAGMAHVGVLEVLRDAGIEVTHVAGTSAGAMVGAAYAAGNLESFRETMYSLTRGRVLRLFDPIWPQAGLLEGRRSLELVRPHLGERIEDLGVAYAAVAADLHTGEEVVLRRGSVAEAVRASITIPGLFTPHRWQGRLLVDGGLVNPVPADVARALGAQFVIAVSVLSVPPAAVARRAMGGLTQQWSERLRRRWRPAVPQPKAATLAEEEDGELGLVDVLSRASALVQARIAEARLRDDPPDFLIHVPLRLGLFDFHRSREAVAAGRKAAQEHLGELRHSLEAALPLVERMSRWLDLAAERWRNAARAEPAR